MTTEKQIADALWKAFSFGETYWQQADSESYSQNRKAAETRTKFNAFVEETAKAIAGEQQPPLSLTNNDALTANTGGATSQQEPVARLESSGLTLSIAQVYTPLGVGQWDVYTAPPVQQALTDEAVIALAEKAGMQWHPPEDWTGFSGAFDMTDIETVRKLITASPQAVKDAARYRWLRANSAFAAAYIEIEGEIHDDKTLDSAIDAAIAATKKDTP